MMPEQEKTDDHDDASVLAEVHHDADHKFRALDPSLRQRTNNEERHEEDAEHHPHGSVGI